MLNFIDFSHKTFVDKKLFLIPLIGLISTIGTCLYAAAWKTISILLTLNNSSIKNGLETSPKI